MHIRRQRKQKLMRVWLWTSGAGVRRFVVLFAWLGSIACVPEQSAAAESATAVPLERRPYRVLAAVAFAADPLLAEPYRRQVLEEISQAADRSVGEMWTLETTGNSRLRPATIDVLQRLSADVLRSRFEDISFDGFDKVFLVVIDVSANQYRLAAREWDAFRRDLGPLHSAETFDRRAVGQGVFALLNALFRPTVVIDDVEEQAVDVRLQAGEYPAPDPQSAQLKPGDLLLPYYRYLDKARRVREIQTLPWTYLRVGGAERGHISCEIQSAFSAPLTGKRRRVESMAVRLRPAHVATRLRLFPRRRPNKPLAAHRVNVDFLTPRERADQRNESGSQESIPQPLRLFSDRWGEVAVPAQAEHPLVWLYVHSGKVLLARVPFVPGIEPTQIIELPDDSVRLGVERDLDLLHADVIDTVIRQIVLIVRARLLTEHDRPDWEKIDSLVAQIDGLPGSETFQTKLRNIRVPAEASVQQAGDRRAQIRIATLCSKLAEIVDHFFDASRVNELKNDLAELR